jgi:4-amino-4-deoxy-L-arabinose transferase-like glycosyltransferase
MTNKKSCLILTLIIILGFTIRIWHLGINPAGFFCDEAATGFNAYSILTTGKDEYGKPFPVFFRSFGDYKNPVFIYSAIPFVAAFGLNEYGTRLTAVAYGIFSIIAIFFLGKELFNRKIALLTAFLLATSPWHIHFSRVAFDIIAPVPWIILALLFLQKSLKRFLWYPLALILLIISFLSYTSPKLYLPPLFLSFLLINFKTTSNWLKDRRFWISNFIIGFFFFLLIDPYIQNGTFFARWNQVKINNFNLKTISQGYFNHFSADFLFKKGDIDFTGQNVTRHSIRGMGELYWFQLPFILIGLSTIVTVKKYRRNLLFLLAALFLFPLGSIFTVTAPQATRSVFGLIPLVLFTAVGIYYFFKLISSSLVIISLVPIVAFSFFNFLNLASRYPFYSSDYWGWQYGYRPIMDIFKREEKSFDQLLVTHRFNIGEELLKFYNISYQCEKCKVMSNPISINVTKKQLFALRTEDVTEAKKLYPDLTFIQKEIIYLPDGTAEIFIGNFTRSVF